MLKQEKFNQLIFVLLIFLALAVGYFQSTLENEKHKYELLEKRHLELKTELETCESARLMENNEADN